MTTNLDRVIDDYLAYLRVERGVADATIHAYRADLTDFAMSRGAASDWAKGPEVAQRYLAARARRGRPNDPGLAPTSLRRRAAAIRGFYRFCYGDGVIAVDIAAHLDLALELERRAFERLQLVGADLEEVHGFLSGG